MCPRSACLQLFVDGELEPTRSSDLEAHLAACETCVERASLLRSMKSSLRRQCGARASDALRAKICLAVARETSSPREPGNSDIGSVSAVFSPVDPSRESLSSDRFRRVAPSAGSPRMAYGVGALALAAGVALAVVGERGGSWTDQGDDGMASRSGLGDGAEAARAGDADRREMALPRQVALDGRADPRVASNPERQGAALGIAQPGSLVPISPVAGPTIGPSLAASAVAGRLFEDRPTFDTLLDDLVAEHMNPPIQMDETNPDKLGRFESTVGVAMRPPKFRKYDARFRGARIVRMHGAQRTAMLSYELPGGERVAVYLWNPQAVPIGTTRLHPRPSSKEGVYVGEARGYSIAACERRGVGYALATKRDTDESVRMVTASLP